MLIERRALMIGVACSAAMSAVALKPGIAQAQSYPNKPIKLIVPFAAGGRPISMPVCWARRSAPNSASRFSSSPLRGRGTDGRGCARKEPSRWLHALPCGRRGAVRDPVHGRQNAVRLAARPCADSPGARVPETIVVNQTIPANNLAEFVAYARANPGKINFGSAGAGSVTHLGVELLKAEAKIDLVHVPYRGAAPAIADLLGNDIQLLCSDVPVIAPYVRDNKLKALAITSAARSTTLPDVPTTGEAGYPKVNSDNWYGLVSPAGTPPEVLARLQKATVAVLQSPN